MNQLAQLIVGWIVISLIIGALAGFVIGRYGHGRCEPRPTLNDLERRCLAAELARTNRMEIKQ
jgi:hypothetical protein